VPTSRPDVRVLLDANVLLSGVVFPRWPWEILRHAVRGDFQLVLCPYVIRQARRRIAQRFPEFLAAFDEFLIRCPYELVPDPSPEDVQNHSGLVRDVTDVPVALAAIQAGVDYLVSEDKDLTEVDETTVELRRYIYPLISGTFLRQVMGWSHEELEAVRGRTWDEVEG
jgi:predicted nucleic acid-binding protein